MNRTLLISIASMSLAACSVEQSAPPAPPASGIDVPALPSQDEADAQAQKAIDAKNAEAEFDRLKKELEGG
jgi:hypothetical protein